APRLPRCRCAVSTSLVWVVRRLARVRSIEVTRSASLTTISFPEREKTVETQIRLISPIPRHRNVDRCPRLHQAEDNERTREADPAQPPIPRDQTAAWHVDGE